MPYTLVHPAAVLPLRRLTGGLLMPSALVVGAMAPDLVGYMPLPRVGLLSHEWLGVVTVAPLLSLVVLALFHGLLKRPLTDLAPAPLRRRLAGPVNGFRWRSWKSAAVILLSTVVGAATHVLWDDLTHGTYVDWGLDPVIGGFTGTQLVQDGSSVVGLVALVWWAVAWYRKAPEGEDPRVLTHTARTVVRLLLAAGILLSAASALVFPPRPLNGEWPTGFGLAWYHATNMLLAGVGTGFLLITLYGVGWTAYRLTRRRTQPV
ncbi:hypothetical protein GCM10010329_49870 [Streptomyces spiroverticillatus]|uniref:DUF4184 family protein n=1 Tax=Streptomyces finlayi TaxID=67296 RepID=A0A918X1L8_9ACTN|nr:DUF4184 family protein [Streptomyces finlayi]GHA20540.1 hypothetical protein GCM10010329_49870 [Streptomyces spiroverticillatus]GHD03269.1 hypothetical protein GCM10010334_50820 [Streptomyces finlayi]